MESTLEQKSNLWSFKGFTKSFITNSNKSTNQCKYYHIIITTLSFFVRVYMPMWTMNYHQKLANTKKQKQSFTHALFVYLRWPTVYLQNQVWIHCRKGWMFLLSHKCFRWCFLRRSLILMIFSWWIQTISHFVAFVLSYWYVVVVLCVVCYCLLS